MYKSLDSYLLTKLDRTLMLDLHMYVHFVWLKKVIFHLFKAC